MTLSDKQTSAIQRYITAGMTFEESGMPEEAREVWDQMASEIATLAENGVLVETVNEWSDWPDEALESFYRPWTEEELAALYADDEEDVAKAAEDATLVSKAVDERRFTLGPMYIPNRRDAHNEWTDPDELQKAVWDYVRKGDRRIRLQHNRDVVAGEFVEVMAWPYEVEVPIVMKDQTERQMRFPPNTVFLGVVWEPWAWELVKADKLRGYSIGGKAERLLADLPEPAHKAVEVPEPVAETPTPVDMAATIAQAVAEAIKQATPIVNVVMPEDKPKARRVERDEHGNIVRIIEEN